jgi:hypothetical protein
VTVGALSLASDLYLADVDERHVVPKTVAPNYRDVRRPLRALADELECLVLGGYFDLVVGHGFSDKPNFIAESLRDATVMLEHRVAASAHSA